MSKCRPVKGGGVREEAFQHFRHGGLQEQRHKGEKARKLGRELGFELRFACFQSLRTFLCVGAAGRCPTLLSFQAYTKYLFKLIRWAHNSHFAKRYQYYKCIYKCIVITYMYTLYKLFFKEIKNPTASRTYPMPNTDTSQTSDVKMWH